jgi:hypothetical protein
MVMYVKFPPGLPACDLPVAQLGWLQVHWHLISESPACESRPGTARVVQFSVVHASASVSQKIDYGKGVVRRERGGGSG